MFRESRSRLAERVEIRHVALGHRVGPETVEDDHDDVQVAAGFAAWACVGSGPRRIAAKPTSTNDARGVPSSRSCRTIRLTLAKPHDDEAVIEKDLSIQDFVGATP